MLFSQTYNWFSNNVILCLSDFFFREEYTYRKLRDYTRPASVDSMLCRCGSPNCSSSRSAACLPSWYPSQSHFIQHMNIPHDMTLKSNVQPMRKAPFQKRLQIPPYVKQLAKVRMGDTAGFFPSQEREVKSKYFANVSKEGNLFLPLDKEFTSFYISQRLARE